MAFNNVQNSISKLQRIQQSNAHWSLRDNDPKYVTTGVGGKQNIFRQAQNLFTNDPNMYKESGYNRTDRTKNPQTQEMMNTFYQYYKNGKDVEDLNLADRSKTF